MSFVDKMVANREYLLVMPEPDDTTARVRVENGTLKEHSYVNTSDNYCPGWHGTVASAVLQRFPDAARQIHAINADVERMIVGA